MNECINEWANCWWCVRGLRKRQYQPTYAAAQHATLLPPLKPSASCTILDDASRRFHSFISTVVTPGLLLVAAAALERKKTSPSLLKAPLPPTCCCVLALARLAPPERTRSARLSSSSAVR